MSRYKKITTEKKVVKGYNLLDSDWTCNSTIYREIKDKPIFNRKKYIESARNEWNKKDENYNGWSFFLFESISIMLDATDRNLRVSPEAVGVAKCLKLAVRLKEFSDRLEEEGRFEYTLKEHYEFIFAIPKDKPKFNRKKYIESARDEWNKKDKNYNEWSRFLFESISIMLDATERNLLRVSPETVGVARCLKLAVRLKEFSDKDVG